MINKKYFWELIKNFDEEIEQFNIVLWHESSDGKDFIYLELLCNNFRAISDYGIYYGDELKETDNNLKFLYTEAKKFRTKIKNWLSGTYLRNTPIIIEEENV